MLKDAPLFKAGWRGWGLRVNVKNMADVDASFDFEVKKARECTPGDYKGDLDTECIYWCNNEGSWELVKCCEDDERLGYDPKFAYDGWECVEKPSSPGFETIFAIMGLLAVAYLVLRRRG